MATQVSDDPQIEQHYLAQVALGVALLEALRRLWPSIDLHLPSGREAAAQVATYYAQVAISLTAEFYEAMRDVEDIAGPYRVPLMDPPPVESFADTLASMVAAHDEAVAKAQAEWEQERETIEAELRAEYEAERQAEIDAEADRLLRKAEAQIASFVDGAGRDELLMAIEGDKEALGFRRVPRPGACYFCLMLAFRRSKRGDLGVYKSRKTAGQLPPNETGEVNRYHTNCKCVVVPIFSIVEVAEPHIQDAEALYREARRKSKRTGKAMQDFRNALAAVRRGDDPRFDRFEDSPIATPAESQADQLAALRNILLAASR